MKGNYYSSPRGLCKLELYIPLCTNKDPRRKKVGTKLKKVGTKLETVCKKLEKIGNKLFLLLFFFFLKDKMLNVMRIYDVFYAMYSMLFITCIVFYALH